MTEYNNLRKFNPERKAKLLKEWLSVKDQLRKYYKPEKIIVFGSFASGNVHEWSDIDVALIKKTDKRYYDRIRELVKCVKYNVGIQFLTYTPEEIAFAIKDKNYFITNEILKKGRVIMGTNRSEAEKWLTYAETDVKASESLLRDGIYSLACFYAQQCIEKSLKAFLLYNNKGLPRAHSLKDILSLCREIKPDFLNDFENEISECDLYYVPTSYPDAALGSLPDGMPTIDHAKDALQWSCEILKIIYSHLNLK